MSRFFRWIYFFTIPLISSCAGIKPTANIKQLSHFQEEPRPLVIIDAGHGGLDLGAKAKAPYIEEKRVALTTALLVRKYLSQLGYQVILTRSTDVFIPLYRRVHLANHSPRSHLFVSIHYNASSNLQARGIEVFYCDCKKDRIRAKESKKLAQSILQQMANKTHSPSRGIKKGNFYVIRESKVPAVLIEGGFISNAQERKKLKDSKYLSELAKAVAQGIDKYFKSRASFS